MPYVSQVEVSAAKKSMQSFGAPQKMGSISYVVDDVEHTKEIPNASVNFFKKDPFIEGSLESFEHYLEDLLKRSCWARLISIIERRDKSADELRQKLTQEGFSPDLVESQLKLAQEKKFINDKRYAQSFIYQKKLQGWDKFRIERELKLRGINLDEIPDYPHSYFSFDDSLERAYNLLTKKSIASKNPYEKFYRFLASKGYSSEVIKQAIKLRLSEEDETC